MIARLASYYFFLILGNITHLLFCILSNFASYLNVFVSIVTLHPILMFQWAVKTKKVPYSQKELADLKNEWADFVLQMIKA